MSREEIAREMKLSICVDCLNLCCEVIQRAFFCGRLVFHTVGLSMCVCVCVVQLFKLCLVPSTREPLNDGNAARIIPKF